MTIESNNEDNGFDHLTSLLHAGENLRKVPCGLESVIASTGRLLAAVYTLVYISGLQVLGDYSDCIDILLNSLDHFIRTVCQMGH